MLVDAVMVVVAIVWADFDTVPKSRGRIRRQPLSLFSMLLACGRDDAIAPSPAT